MEKRKKHRPAKFPNRNDQESRNRSAPTNPKRSRAGRKGVNDGTAAHWIYGTHAVTAALSNPKRRFDTLLVTEEALKHLADVPNLSPTRCTAAEIAQALPPGSVHQGIALRTEPLPEVHLDQLRPEQDTPSQILVILDQVTDPHNVGAILRSAAAFGASAVIQQSRNAPPATGTLAKAASGALEWIPLVEVINLARTLRELADWGYFRIGLSDEAELSLDQADTSGHVVLVLGAEGKGLRQLTRQNCDLIARLPTTGTPASLNVSNAAAVALYELARAS